jgi:hypothetical protein
MKAVALLFGRGRGADRRTADEDVGCSTGCTPAAGLPLIMLLTEEAALL